VPVRNLVALKLEAMAEIFGTAAGAMSIAALLSNCVDCFEYIQLGRHFGRDFESYQLKLDIARTRLGRWGEVVGINDDPRFVSEADGDEAVQLARCIIEGIADLFESARKTSKRYELRTPKCNSGTPTQHPEMSPVSRGLHNRLRALAHQRQKGTTLIKKTAWALYDGKQFEKLVSQILELVDELEKVLPVESACRKLAELEVEQVADEQSLPALEAAAKSLDQVLLDVVTEKIANANGGNFGNFVKDAAASDSAEIQVGDQYGEACLVLDLSSFVVGLKPFNTIDRVVAKGSARVQVGSRFGVRF